MSSRLTVIRNAVCSLLIILPLSLHAQRVKFQHIGLEDGLSQDIVTAIAQDSLGFMWFGTEDGLNKYDGYSVTVFKHNAHDTNSLPSNVVNTLMVDSRGRIWVGTAKGASIIEPGGSERLTSLGVEESYTAFCEGEDGNIWASTRSALLRCTPDGQTLRVSLGLEQWSEAKVMLYERQEKRLFVGSRSGISAYTVSGDSLIPLLNLRGMKSMSGYSIMALCRTSSKDFFVATLEHGLFRLDSSLEQIWRYHNDQHDPQSLSDNRVLALAEDKQRRLWIGTFSGLDLFDAATEKFVRHNDMENDLHGNRVYSFCVDRTGALWVGTYRGGVNRLDPRRQRFGHIGHQNQPGGLRAHNVFSLLETREGDLWVGTDEGLFRRRRGTDSFHRYTHDARRSHGKGSPAIFALFQQSNGDLWAGGAEGVLSRYEPARDEFIRDRNLLPDAIRAIYETEIGALLVGTEARGAFIRDSLTHEFVPWQVLVDSAFPSAGVWAMHRDRKGFLWLGTFYLPYIVRINTQTQIATRIVNDPENEHALVAPSVRAFCEPGDDVLYLGTWGGGVGRYDRENDSYKWYVEESGLPSNYVKAMQSDERGRIWIATEKGLVRYDPKTESFRIYTVEDGLQSNFFWSGSSCKGKDGTLYFGGTNGFNMFHPDSIVENSADPPMVITSMRVLDRPLQIPDDRIVTLGHDADFFSFEFVSLDYTAPRRNQYAYMLEGFDRGWVKAGTRRYAAYTHLDPGEYVFKVKGTNSEGVWSSNIASIRLTITPAFWQTLWFRLVIALMIIVALYATYRMRLSKFLEIERTRSAIATDLHDDIGTSLTGIALFSDLARGEIDTNTVTARARLQHIADNSRSLLDKMNDIVWSIKPENDALEQTILRMEDYAVEMLEENGIDLHVQIPEQLKKLKLPMAVRRNLFLIFKEAIGNILKHSAATHVDMVISATEARKRHQQLRLVISDNGKGFNPSVQDRGNGLDNMEHRTQHLNGSISILSVEGQGTRIEIVFPIKSPI